jgi:hypothetical protein
VKLTVSYVVDGSGEKRKGAGVKAVAETGEPSGGDCFGVSPLGNFWVRRKLETGSKKRRNEKVGA